jgi:hypothetical protein
MFRSAVLFVVVSSIMALALIGSISNILSSSIQEFFTKFFFVDAFTNIFTILSSIAIGILAWQWWFRPGHIRVRPSVGFVLTWAILSLCSHSLAFMVSVHHLAGFMDPRAGAVSAVLAVFLATVWVVIWKWTRATSSGD